MIDLSYKDALVLAQVRYLHCTDQHRIVRRQDDPPRLICACGRVITSIGGWGVHVQHECGVPVG